MGGMDADTEHDAQQPALPTSPTELLERLAALGIPCRTIEHPPLRTVEESKALRGELPGAHIKNLFLRNKQECMWLVVAQADRPIDLKKLGAALGAGRLSFGSPERLRRFLGVLPGAVTPFALINDTGCQVRAVLDRAILDEVVANCHPLVNTQTTAIAPDDLLRFLRSTGHEPQILDFRELAP